MTITQNLIKIIPLTIILCGLLTYSFMQAQWVGPTATAPTANTLPPINTGTTTQSKLGNFNAFIVSAASSTWSPKYCNETGGNCVTSAGLAAGSGLGIGQQWVNLTSSRAWSVNYQNTTGKPIQVYARSLDGSGAYVHNGTGWVMVGYTDGNSSTWESYSFIVPNNALYVVQGSGAVLNWSELR